MKFSKTYLHYLLCPCSLSCKILGQDSDMPSVLISTSSVTQIPADAIYFSITLSTQNEDPQESF